LSPATTALWALTRPTTRVPHLAGEAPADEYGDRNPVGAESHPGREAEWAERLGNIFNLDRGDAATSISLASNIIDAFPMLAHRPYPSGVVLPSRLQGGRGGPPVCGANRAKSLPASGTKRSYLISRAGSASSASAIMTPPEATRQKPCSAAPKERPTLPARQRVRRPSACNDMKVRENETCGMIPYSCPCGTAMRRRKKTPNIRGLEKRNQTLQEKPRAAAGRWLRPFGPRCDQFGACPNQTQ